jgi:translation initiation factor 2B subunit (eIF-2B alpha/beta/delta family)
MKEIGGDQAEQPVLREGSLVPDIILPAEFLEAVCALAVDNRSGAAALAAKAAQALARLFEREPAEGEAAFVPLALAAAREVIRTQPEMAPMFRLAHGAVLAAERAAGPVEQRHAALRFCLDFEEGLKQHAALIAQAAGALIGDGDTVLTHSFSATVRDALLLAHAQGKRFRAVCTESRPVLEGITLASQLGRAGIETHLIVDSAAYLMMPAASVILVGADSIGEAGVCNKIGTLGLAVAARHGQRRIFAACGTEKFWPAGYRAPEPRVRAAQEVMEQPPRGVTAANYPAFLTTTVARRHERAVDTRRARGGARRRT